MATDKLRYSITVSEQLFQDIEDFRFTNRFDTRTEATLVLIQMGLDSLKTKGKAPLKTNQRRKEDALKLP